MRKYSLGMCAMLLALMLGPPKPLSAGTLELTFKGASSYLGGYYVAPYQIKIGSTTYNMICDDANDDVTPGEQWSATTETFSNLSGAVFPGAPGQSVTQLQAYEQAGLPGERNQQLFRRHRRRVSVRSLGPLRPWFFEHYRGGTNRRRAN